MFKDAYHRQQNLPKPPAQEPSFAICAMAMGLCTFRSGTWKNEFEFIPVRSCTVFFGVGSISWVFLFQCPIFIRICCCWSSILLGEIIKDLELPTPNPKGNLFDLQKGLRSATRVLGAALKFTKDRLGVLNLRTEIPCLLAKLSKSIPVLVALQSLKPSEKN